MEWTLEDIDSRGIKLILDKDLEFKRSEELVVELVDFDKFDAGFTRYLKIQGDLKSLF